MSENEMIDLPQAAAALGRSSDAVKRLLLRRPDLDAAIARRWGRRLLTAENVEAIRAAFAERELQLARK